MKRQPKQSNPPGDFEKLSGMDPCGNVNPEESLLEESVRKYMKGRFDIEDVKNDPGLPYMETTVMEMVADYNRNTVRNKDNEKFIKDAFSEIPEEMLLDEIRHISYEINNSKINDITAEWVKEWHETRQKKGALSSNRKEIEEFIHSSLEAEAEQPVSMPGNGKRSTIRPLIIRYTSLAAAAVAGIFVAINMLIPVSDPDKLYDSFYSSPDAVSPVTRSIDENYSFIFAKAIDNYNKGDFEAASIGFNSSVSLDTCSVSPRYLLGVTELELGNYDNAIKILSDISVRNGPFSKEAMWSLGFSYLKSGNTEKAYECFTYLANHSDYYGKRSEKILRGLK